MADAFFQVLAGLRANILERENVGIVVSSENTLFRKERLTDHRPSQEFRFDAAAADDAITVDANQVGNGNLQSWIDANTPNDFSAIVSGSGAVTQTDIGGGDFVARLTNGASGNAEIVQDLVFPSGERIRALWGSRTTNVDSPAEVEVYNRITGKYLTSDGVTWSSTQQNFKTYAGLTQTDQVEEFTLEGPLETLSHEVTIQIRFHMDGAAASRTNDWDDVFLFPFVNYASVHGHNILPRVTVELRSSTDNFSGSDVLQATFELAKPTFFATITTAVAFRYWRILFSGTNDDPIRVGQSAIGQARQLDRNPFQRGFQVNELQPQRTAETVHSGEQWRTNLTDLHQRMIRLRFRWCDTALDQLRDEIMLRTRRGLDPMFIVADDSKKLLATHARVANEFQYRRVALDVEEGDLIITESPFGMSIP